MKPQAKNAVTIAHTARRLERKIEDVLGEYQFWFRRGKGSRDATGMLRTISELTLEINAEVCVGF
jgi:hypothetical protein